MIFFSCSSEPYYLSSSLMLQFMRLLPSHIPNDSLTEPPPLNGVRNPHEQ